MSNQVKGQCEGKMVLQSIVGRLQTEENTQLLLDRKIKNVGFYQHLGFKLTQTKSADKLKIYSMQYTFSKKSLNNKRILNVA
ncbi:MAG: hypothetical protein HRU38_13610 [Saccharospirillaceae bacterium]|nr:hypothetical protein [Pseudomonadales bacterium]NRB79681.1 hypothetical protein [Saccharospirillaceae bacterium]